MNKIILHGNVTNNPEISVIKKGVTRKQSVNDGTLVANFSLAVNRNSEEADFFNCTAFNDKAELIEKYVVKGQELIIEGTCQNNFYEDKNGNMQYANRIIVNRIEFCGNKH